MIINRRIIIPLTEDVNVKRFNSGRIKSVTHDDLSTRMRVTYYLAHEHELFEREYFLGNPDTSQPSVIIRDLDTNSIISKEFFFFDKEQHFKNLEILQLGNIGAPRGVYRFPSYRHCDFGPAYVYYHMNVISHTSYYHRGEKVGENLGIFSKENLDNHLQNFNLLK